jgi:hypothetical protein
LATGDNNRFIRLWHEVSKNDVGFGYANREVAKISNKKWFPYNKGGDYRKWYGNQEYVVNWQNDGYEIRSFYDTDGRLRSRPQNLDSFFKVSLSWSKVTIANFSLRYFPQGFIYDVAGCAIFTQNHDLRRFLLSIMNSPIMSEIIGALSPTMNYEVGQVASFPIIKNYESPSIDLSLVDELIALVKSDWDSFETSWDFETLPLININYICRTSLKDTYYELRKFWNERTEKVKALEEKNNFALIG